MKLKEIGEFGWISRMRSRLPKPGKKVLAGVGDDAAWVKVSNSSLVTCDLLIENVHFIRDMIPPRLLGRKALSVNISDIAAMGGIPEFALLAAGFPTDIDLEYVDEFFEGFHEVALENKVEIIGGDTTASPMFAISVTVLGRPSAKAPVLRSTARPGDEIWVTGTVGDASLGFEILKKSREQESEISDLHYASLTVRHFDPTPRVQAGIRLAGIAHSMIDVSDGILSDLTRILEESGGKAALSAKVELEKIPLSFDFKKYFDDRPLQSGQALSLALTGGEDYELLFTAAPGREKQIRRIAKELDLPFSQIGKIAKAKKLEIILVDQKGKRVPRPKPWFEHFPKPDKTDN